MLPGGTQSTWTILCTRPSNLSCKRLFLARSTFFCICFNLINKLSKTNTSGRHGAWLLTQQVSLLSSPPHVHRWHLVSTCRSHVNRNSTFPYACTHDARHATRTRACRGRHRSREVPRQGQTGGGRSHRSGRDRKGDAPAHLHTREPTPSAPEADSAIRSAHVPGQRVHPNQGQTWPRRPGAVFLSLSPQTSPRRGDVSPARPRCRPQLTRWGQAPCTRPAQA